METIADKSRTKEIIERLQSIMDGASPVPLASGKVMIYKDEVQSLLTELRTQIDMEMKTYHEVNDRRGKIINEAKKEAERIIYQAEHTASRMRVNRRTTNVDPVDFANLSQEELDELDNANEIYGASLIYTDEMLTEVSNLITDTYENMKNDYEIILGAMEEKIQILSENRKELMDGLSGMDAKDRSQQILEIGQLLSNELYNAKVNGRINPDLYDDGSMQLTLDLKTEQELKLQEAEAAAREAEANALEAAAEAREAKANAKEAEEALLEITAERDKLKEEMSKLQEESTKTAEEINDTKSEKGATGESVDAVKDKAQEAEKTADEKQDTSSKDETEDDEEYEIVYVTEDELEEGEEYEIEYVDDDEFEEGPAGDNEHEKDAEGSKISSISDDSDTYEKADISGDKEPRDKKESYVQEELPLRMDNSAIDTDTKADTKSEEHKAEVTKADDSDMKLTEKNAKDVFDGVPMIPHFVKSEKIASVPSEKVAKMASAMTTDKKYSGLISRAVAEREKALEESAVVVEKDKYNITEF